MWYVVNLYSNKIELRSQSKKQALRYCEELQLAQPNEPMRVVDYDSLPEVLGWFSHEHRLNEIKEKQEKATTSQEWSELECQKF